MECKFLSWNVRELGGRDKHMLVRNRVFMNKLLFLCLQETILEHLDCYVVREVWGEM